MDSKTYTVGEVDFSQKALLMSKIGKLWAWVESLPDGHVLKSFKTISGTDETRLLEVIKSMLMDGTLLKALSLVLTPDKEMSTEEIEKHLEENLDIPTGIVAVTDFFIFNMETLSESSGLIENQKVKVEKTRNLVLSKSTSESSETSP